MINKFIRNILIWLKKIPNENDFFFVNIRQAFQIISRTFKNDQNKTE